jgi:hypothetical protein
MEDDSLLERSPDATGDVTSKAPLSQGPSEFEAGSGRKRRQRRAVASPRSTSGAASAFEHRVAKLFLVDLLTETNSESFYSGRIVGVALQQAVHGVVIDDIVIEYELAGAMEVFDLDVKSGLDFIPSDNDFLDVLDGCLDRYKMLADRPGIYGFATKNDNRPAKFSVLQNILDRAQNETRADYFRRAIQTPGHGDDTLRKVYGDLETAIHIIEPLMTLPQIHDFLRSFHAISFGAGISLDQADQIALHKLKRILNKTEDESKYILSVMQTIAVEVARTSGHVNRQALLKKLRQVGIQFDEMLSVARSIEELAPARSSIPEN